jgi:hypothetical protein
MLPDGKTIGSEALVSAVQAVTIGEPQQVGPRFGRRIGRRRGLLFLAYYFAYVAYLILGAQDHDALDEYSAIMLGFVIPITIVTLVAMLIREQKQRDETGG